MRSFFLSIIIAVCALQLHAQPKTAPEKMIYDPKADAQQGIDEALALAKKEHKNVFLQIGGNWCIWCMRFNEFVHSESLWHTLNDNYVVVHVNYSPENKNEKILAKLEYPQRFGYPVFVILSPNGRRLHTQNSGYLEEGKGYNGKRVKEFLEQWSPKALDPDTYKNEK